MNWVLKVLTCSLVAANIIYPLTQNEADGSAVSREGSHVVRNQEDLAVSIIPVLITSSTPSTTKTDAIITTAPEVLECLKISAISSERKEEALTMLGQSVQAKAFVDGALWSVRFGPWPNSEILPLQELLGKWAGVKAAVCVEKEKEEWKKSK